MVLSSSRLTLNAVAYRLSLASDNLLNEGGFKCFFTCHFQKQVYPARIGISINLYSIKDNSGLAWLFSTFSLADAIRASISSQATSSAFAFTSQPVLSSVT